MGRAANNWKIYIRCAAVLILLCIPLPAHTAGLSLDYVLGFNGHFQINKWTPIAVVLENRGRTIRGTLEVVVTSGSEYRHDVYQNTYAMEIELPTNSKKRYSFTVLIESVTHELSMRLKQKDNIMVSKSVNLRSHFTEKGFAVVADDFASPGILAVMPKQLYAVDVRPKFLPETWYGYNSVKLLIMKADTISRLRPRQYQALTEWLRQGGYLVTSGGLNYGALFKKRIQDILPVDVQGHIRLSELKSLAQFCSRSLIAHKPFLVLNVRIDDSHVVVKEKNIPIVIQKKFGLGRIIFLSFDYNMPPFNRWDGRGLFWDKIESMRPSAGIRGIVVDDQKIVDSMSAKIPAHFQSLTSAAVFIGAYLALLWFFLKRIRKPGKQRWKNSAFLFATIIIFTAIGYWRFFYPNTMQKFTYNSFGQLDISDRNSPATLKYFIGLYALKKTSYSLDLGASSYPVTHILSKHSKNRIPNPYVLDENYSGQHIVGSLNKWSHSFYKINSKLDAPLAGHAERDDRQLTIQVENKLPLKIVDCLVYYKKRFVFVDKLLSNTQQKIQLKFSDLKKIEIFNEQALEQITKRYQVDGASSYLKISQQNLTADVLRAIHDQYKLNTDRLVIIGWIPDGVFQPGFHRDLGSGENLTLLKWVLPVEMTS
jgi:hypothetical protein